MGGGFGAKGRVAGASRRAPARVEGRLQTPRKAARRCAREAGWARSPARTLGSPVAPPLQKPSLRALLPHPTPPSRGGVQALGAEWGAQQVERAGASRPEGLAQCAAGQVLGLARGRGSWPNPGGRAGPRCAGLSPARTRALSPGSRAGVRKAQIADLLENEFKERLLKRDAAGPFSPPFCWESLSRSLVPDSSLPNLTEEILLLYLFSPERQ